MSSLTFILPASTDGVTTPGAIAARIVAIIQGLTPITESGITYVEHVNEGLDLRDAAESNPEGCFRRFEVRFAGDRDPPEVSNTDLEAEERDFEVVIAYPATNRFATVRGRDAVVDEDANQINHYVGTNGYGTIDDCTMVTESVTREDGDSAVFGVIALRAHFYRSQAA